MGTKQINYTQDWCMKLPNNEEDWGVLVEILKGIGCRIFDEDYDENFYYINPLTCSEIGRGTMSFGDEVSLYEAIRRLQRPIKTPEQLQIEELENTIKDLTDKAEAAKMQIEQLKNNQH